MKNNLYWHSYFADCRQKQSTSISLEEFFQRITTGFYRRDAEMYRQLMDEGKLKEAAALKNRQPAITVSGQFEGGHSAACQVSMSGCMAADIDHTNERTGEFMQQLCALPYVAGCMRSFSGKGIKCFVRIDALTPDEYRTAYACVIARIESLLQFACDKQCKDVARLCYVSYDPEAYFNPHAEVFPWRDGAGQAVPPEPAPVNVPGDAAEEAGASQGFIPAFLRDAIRYQGYTRGKRHNFMLELGRRAARKGFSLQEMELLMAKACEGMTQEDYTAAELRSDLLAGYQYVMKNAEGDKVTGDLSDTFFRAKREEEEMEMSEKSQELRAATPCFSDEILADLPPFLQKVRAVAGSPREADFLLMAVITHLSVCIPNVSFGYGHEIHHPNLFFAAVSPPATCKGVVEMAKQISAPINKHYLELGKRAEKEYEADLQAWELERSATQRAKRTNLRPAPEKPVCKHIHIPASITKALMVQYLYHNGTQGSVIHTSEINALAASIGNEFGKQDDMLCAAAQNESYAYGSKAQGGTFTVDRLNLAMCLTGTPDQFVLLVDSQSNGLYSRWSLLTAPEQYEFRNREPVQADRMAHNVIRQLGEEVLEMHLKLLEMPPSEITFTSEQWARHQAHFDEKLKSVALEGGSEPGAIIVRSGLRMMRTSAVFTMLRKWDDRIFASERICSDTDFAIAMHMTDVLDAHGLLVTTSLPASSKRARALRPFFNILPIIEKMPDTFTYTELVKAVQGQGYSERTGKRVVKKAETMKLIEKQGDVYRKTTKRKK